MSAAFKIAIAGLGTVGGGVVKALAARGEDLSLRAGRELKIVGVSSRNPKRALDLGLDLRLFANVALALANSDADVVVELIGGEEGIAASWSRPRWPTASMW